MEVCGGFDSEDLKPGWATCSLGEIDRNPFNECRFDETFRSFNCKRLVKRNSWRCCECAKLKKPLKRRAEFAKNEEPHANTPNIYLSEEQRLKKLNEQAIKLKNAKREIARLREKVRKLIDDGVKIDTDLADTFSEILGNCNISPAQSVFLQEQIKASQQKKGTGMRWHPTMIRLALQVYTTSPAAYEILKDTGMVRLPCNRTLFDYGRVKPLKEGVDTVVLDSVAERVRNLKHGYQKYHVLMADDMYISQNLVFLKGSGRLVGYVNMDDVDQEVRKLENYLSDVNDTE